MELLINISGRDSNQREEKFRKWKAESFQPQAPRDDDPKKMMDEELYKYAAEDRFDELFGELRRVSSAELLSIIHTQVSPSGNSLLHVSASHGSKDVTELLLQHFPHLITRENFHKNTALHLAARAGQLGTTAVLINKAKGHGGGSGLANFVEMKNDKGNNALHDAVINCHHDVACFLVSGSSKLSYIENNEHKSPLYLAVENSIDKKSDEKMLEILMSAITDDVDLLNKLEGKSPVHAAVKGRKKNILEKIANKKAVLLRRKDEKGGNPLHCAASAGYVWETNFLFDKYRDGAIQENDEGNMPIHVASKKGHVDVVDAYISKWTDPTEFLNRKEQNILHVAAESGKHRMVKYILGNYKLKEVINKQDTDGNTPLHLASKNGQYITTFFLVRNSMVKRRIANGENMTPYEDAEKQSKIMGGEYTEKPISNGKGNQVDRDDKNGGNEQPKRKLDYYGVVMTFSILHFFASPEKSRVAYFRIQSKPLPKEEIKGRIHSLLVIAVLIASVTFAGVLQLPKSADQPGSGTSNMNTTYNFQNQGISAENKGIARNVYIYLDMLAFNASVMASIILCWAQLYDSKVSSHVVWVASLLVGGAIYLMCLAFSFAVAIQVGKSLTFFLVTMVVGGGLFLVQTLLSAPLMIPPSANEIIERIILPYIYFFIFICYFALESLLFKFSNRRNTKLVEQQQTTSSWYDALRIDELCV